MKHSLRILASLLVSAAFLFLAARGVSWPEVWEALRTARLVYVVPMVGGAILTLYLRALRWGTLVAPLGAVGFGSLFSATCIGFGANMILPLRAGEFLRPLVLARREGIALAAAMATIALERVFDMAVLVLLFYAATLALPLPPEWKRYGTLFLATFLLLVAGVIAYRRYPDGCLRLLATVLRPAPQRVSARLMSLVRQFGEGLQSLESTRSIALAAFYSLGVWLSIAVCFGFGLSAFALDVPWVRGALTTTTFTAIAVSIPGGPGFIGMFQAGCVMALAVYGVSASLAFSYSVLEHLVQFASTVALGLYFFLRQGLSLREIRDLQVKETGDPGVSERNRKLNVGAPR